MMTARKLRIALIALVCGILVALNISPSSKPAPMNSDAVVAMMQEADSVRASIDEIQALIASFEGDLDTSELEEELAVTEGLLAKIEQGLER